MTCDGAGKFLPGIAGGGDRRGIAVLDEWRDVLRDIRENAQRTVARDRDDRATPGCPRSSIRGHEMARIDVARRDDALERRRYRFVLLIGDVLVEGRAGLKHRTVGFIA